MVVEGKKKILIVGAGFGGVRVALDLAREKLPGVKITLLSDKSHFEYHPALYKVVTGRSPLETCIPLREIFKRKKVELVEDSVSRIDLAGRRVVGISGSEYPFDFLVLALGSETGYFNIPGLQELSYGFKSIEEALKLKRHLHKIFEMRKDMPTEEKVVATHIVVVGAGASGTELSAELAIYARTLAKQHGVHPSLVTVDLIESSPRVLPSLPEDVSARAMARLHSLGVNIFLNRALVREEIDDVYLKDMEVKTKTLIWTAGVKPNRIFGETEEFKKDEKGRVVVNSYLEVEGFPGVFVLGDAASTPYSGMAQTALGNGSYVADAISRKIAGRKIHPYKPKKPFYAIPIGHGWGVVIMWQFHIYGRLGWYLRRLADLRFFLSILPLRGALRAYMNGYKLCESCSICEYVEDK